MLADYNRLEMQDVPVPEMGPDEVLVRVKAVGICGSDVHGMDGSTGRRQPPVIMGHEAAGVIAESGQGVRDWTEGDRVTFDSTIYCGKCWFCRRGQINLCDARRVFGVSCDEYRQHGAMAQYVAVPKHILYRLPEDVTFERAAMVEPLSIAVHAVHRTKIALGDVAVVVGTGMVGLLVVQALRAAGCGRIVAVDVDPGKLELACRLGADVGIDANDVDVAGQVRRMAAGRGADVAFEVVGITPTVQTAAHCLRKGGQLTLVGNLSPQIEFPLQTAVTREIRIHGSCASRGDYPVCLEAIGRGTVDVDPLIGATAPLHEGASWFARLYGKEDGLLKVLLVP